VLAEVQLELACLVFAQLVQEVPDQLRAEELRQNCLFPEGLLEAKAS
jgi:hypothetical protein